MIQRNTDGTHTLKADAFATADCKFQLGQPRPWHRAAAGSFITGRRIGRRRPDAPSATRTSCCSVSPTGRSSTARSTASTRPGINGQAVYNGTAGADRVYGGNDNDTFWGDAGNDVIEGNGGDDVALGGDGNDIITDLAGADVLKGGPGNDAIDGGTGDDISWAATAQDFLNGGANDNEDVRRPGQRLHHRRPGRRRRLRRRRRRLDPGRRRARTCSSGDHGAPFFDDPARDRAGQRHLRRPGRRERLRRRGWRRHDVAERRRRPQRRCRRVRLGHSTSTTPWGPTTT